MAHLGELLNNRMLSERKAAILRSIVEGYITTSQPVGSGHVVHGSDVRVSPATVRAEMVALEDAGYLHQPHTSAGRIPTEKGYRYFVDTLMEPYQLAQSESTQVKTFFDTVHGELERLLRETSSFVAELTEYTAVVVGPDPHIEDVRAVNLVRLADETVLVVVVLSNGAIERWNLPVAASVDDVQLDRASRALAGHLTGTNLSAVTTPPSLGDPALDALLGAAVDAVALHLNDAAAIYLGGASTVAGLFDAVGKVRDILEVLEKQYLVVTLVRDVLDRGLSVAIGSETGVEPLQECSLVVAPYEVDGHTAGSIAVLGPTRMNYPQTLAAVAVVSHHLGHRLSEG